jgi:hypothetical protein
MSTLFDTIAQALPKHDRLSHDYLTWCAPTTGYNIRVKQSTLEETHYVEEVVFLGANGHFLIGKIARNHRGHELVFIGEDQTSWDRADFLAWLDSTDLAGRFARAGIKSSR